MKKENKKGKRNRDAGTGKFVTEQYAEKHKDTTVTETVEKKKTENPD